MNAADGTRLSIGMKIHGRRIFAGTFVAISIAGLMSACLNPYACVTESRSAEYKGRLGLDAPLEGELTARDPGRIFLSLDEARGADEFRQVSISLNVWGFADSVEAIHVHRKTGLPPGKLLFTTSSGYLVRDSVWNGYPQLYSGPASWAELWNSLDQGDAYLELHPGNGRPVVRAFLTFARGRGFQPSCT